MRNVSDKVAEIVKTLILLLNNFHKI